MRILMLIDGLSGGGAEKVVLTLAQGLYHQGHQVALFSLRDICCYSRPPGIHYRVITDDCHHPWRKLTEIQRRAHQLDTVLRESEPFDLILSHLHKTDRIVSRSQVLPRERVWFCLHGMFSHSYLGHRTGYWRWLKQYKIRQVYQQRNVVAVSQAVAQDLIQQFKITPNNLKVINNPFDIQGIRLAGEAPCEMSGQDYIIHVGRFHVTKRHDRLLKAYAASRIPVPLLLLGDGDHVQREYLQALCQRLDIVDRVIFKPFQANPYPYIYHAKMLVLSSDSEGFGNVLVEALLLGTPVVSTNCPGGPSEILTKELAYGLSAMETIALAQTMTKVYYYPPSIQTAQFSQYEVEAICQQYLDLSSLE